MFRNIFSHRLRNKVFYKIRILPNKAFFNKLFLWVPLPYEMEASEVFFNVTPTKISQEKKFGNKMAFFEIKKKKIRKEFFIEESFPLVKDKSFPKLFNFSIADFKQDSDYEKYTTADSYIQSDSIVIKKLAKKIAGKRKNLLVVIKDFYNYILSVLTYGNPTLGLYTSLQAFDFRIVDCGGFSTLFCALCQAGGIPARLVSGFFARNTTNFGYHAWSEFMLPNKFWVPVDLAMAKIKNKNYFGKFYEKRIIFCKGTDFSLIPPLPDKEKASILQSYYLRLNEGGNIDNLKAEIEIRAD